MVRRVILASVIAALLPALAGIWPLWWSLIGIAAVTAIYLCAEFAFWHFVSRDAGDDHLHHD